MAANGKLSGPIVRIALNFYSIDDPSAMKTLYGVGSNFAKGPWYSAASDPNAKIRDVFTELDRKQHAAHRRQISQLYSEGAFLKMEHAVDDCVREFSQKLSGFSRTGEVIDLQWWVQAYAFDVIVAITLDKRFGIQDKGEDSTGLMATLHKIIAYVAKVGVYPEWHSLMSKLSNFFGGSGLAALAEFTAQQIQERLLQLTDKESTAGGGDFLTSVLRLHEEDPIKFPMDMVFLTCLQNVGAGTDTTSISLVAILWHLMTNPRALYKLRAEIDEKTANGQLSDPPTFAETQQMPYFQAVILEGLRIHPAAAFPLVRIVPKGGASIAGRFFPEGESVVINCWVAHSNEAVFGPDVDQFKPERWLTDKETVSQMSRYWIPFGHGARTCLGKNICLMEISKLVPHLLRKYDFQRADLNADIKCEYVSFVKKKDLMVRIVKREV